MILLITLILPTLIALGFYVIVNHKINYKMFLLQIVVQFVIMLAYLGILSWNNTHDVEVWNGRVVSKEHHHISCKHSYSCNCRSVTSGYGKKATTSIQCDTCYEHYYDVVWYAHTSNEESIEINTVNRQGTIEPPRWTSIQIGEPTAVKHSYTNYVKGSPGTLFRKTGLLEQFKDKIPTHPEPFDYYHMNRFIPVGLSVTDIAQWNKDLEEINAQLGRSKQVNIMVLATKNQPEDYYYAIEQSWIGGKKNDFIVMINVDDGGKVTWSKVMAWSDNKLAETVVADAMVKIGALDRPKMIAEINTGVSQNFQRKHMKDFEYLNHHITMTTGDWIFNSILGLILSVGIGIFYIKSYFEI